MPFSPRQNIPMFLETPERRSTQKSCEIVEQPPYAPDVEPHGRSICYPRIAPPAPPMTFSRKIEYPDVAHDPTRQQTRRPLRYFLGNKVSQEKIHFSKKNFSIKVRRHARYNSLTEPRTVPHVELGHSSKSSLGLGISDPSADRPGTTPEIFAVERDNTFTNFAQRFEKKIWNYNSSGSVAKRWILEIFSWVISALCMAAIIGVLLSLKDEQLPKWPGGLTLNAYISVLSKITSAALLLPTSEALGQLKWSWFRGDSKKMWDFEIFDEASRGPWGSILLLIRTKGRNLAALGAAITLLSLTLDPFFQQVVDFPERWTSGSKGFVAITTFYEPRLGSIFNEIGRTMAQRNQDMWPVGEKFFYSNGTQPMKFGNGTRAEIPLFCPTSNCTWPAYETLGVCSSCVDASQLLTFGCHSTRVDWIANLTGAYHEPTYPNGTVCGYFLNATSDTPVLMSGYNVDPVSSIAGRASAGEALLMRALPLITYPSRQPLFGGSINFKHIRHRIIDVLISGAPNGAEGVYRNETPIAHECAIYWCVKTIKSSYYLANYEEEVVKTFINTTAAPPPFYSELYDDISRNGTSVKYTENVTITTPSANYSSSVYGLSNSTALHVINIFDIIFPSFTTVINGSAEPRLRFGFPYIDPITRNFNFNPWLPPNNITLHLERLAIAMTNALRSSPLSPSQMSEGTAYHRENFVSVRWIWLALPLSLLLLSFIFLFSTIVLSSRERDDVGIWKTSAIATLLHGLPDELQRKIKTSTIEGTPRTKAKELKVRLHPKGWKVSENLFSPKVMQNHPPPGWI